jgi:demethylmenaquinone methyltransferase/2-methoxy-6-polyprenyl-1,4-benzoquinol methylase
MGNPDNYRMLGVYTLAFGDCGDFFQASKRCGFEDRYERNFFGCASGVIAIKPTV